ncbi:related to excision repair protein RAD4 [Cephalotrichum gorgonifer]|uniref:Related to excision repair protein RAD4 n=1 Tax=Cephalotrichum gorgonifer TaxID=2041049 RepID=A0AAE8STJ6_9PEZI|nr:related to excision repair protein RAD4 [Cephalotrichum gorgonifer]
MPPHVPRKRLRDGSPKASGSDAAQAGPAQASGSKKPKVTPRVRTLFDDLDAMKTPDSSKVDIPHLDTSSDDGSELTDLSDIDLEDVPLPNRQNPGEPSDDDDDDDDEGIEFEDVVMPAQTVPIPSGDLELTLRRDTRISLTAAFGKKGPSKIERKIRVATHCIHVLLLLWHNAVRNAWLCDEEVQAIMISHVPPRLWDEIDRWRRNSGLEKSKPDTKSKAKAQEGKGKESREWGPAATKLEEATVDMSHGDPLFRLMQSLVGWWKQRFKVTAPGIRKWGYMTLERLDRVTKAYRSADGEEPTFGERIPDLEAFRLHAQKCEGSRDVGAQLFTALLRGLGMDARLVANLQPLGFGWNKLEDADPEPENGPGQYSPAIALNGSPANKSPKKGAKGPAKPSTSGHSTGTSTRSTTIGRKKMEDNSDEEMASGASDSDRNSVEMSEIAKRNIAPRGHDKDLDFPHYWTEVRSPVTDKYVPVDAIVKKLVGTSRELIESLEPRGGKAEKKRQVMAYIVGFSSDGTAKDVTVRYLKRQMLPGKTKGVRMPVKKTPVHNRHGKIKRYEEYDWFTRAMAGYTRGGKQHPVTEVDQLEDVVDLRPAKVEKKVVKEGEETLQYYKTSQEYVLERHLKREEALLPDAKPVKVFKSKSKGTVNEEPVYLRSDVVHVKSAETWHKQGRAPIPGEMPLKRVPYRAATINRQRELAEAEKATGEKVLQGLYSMEQTDWIIPPPIKDGIIPKNEYGNIDLFVEHMCPEGAVHIPYRGAVRVCKRLKVDYAEAVIDFEFGHRMAVPVIQGVVIPDEYYERVMEELQKDEVERARKEDEKRRKAALGMWRKLLMGMRIARRIREEYGEIGEGVEVFGHFKDNFPDRAGETSGGGPGDVEDADMAGGFLPAGYEDEMEDDDAAGTGMGGTTSGFFPVVDEDDEGDDSLLVQDDRQPAEKMATAQPEEDSEPDVGSRGRAGGRGQPKRKT